MVRLMAPPLEGSVVAQLATDLPPAFISLLLPGIFLYLALYAFARRWKVAFWILSVPALGGLWMSTWVAPVQCAAFQAFVRFTVEIATMKLLDIHALNLTSSFPRYSSGSAPRPSIMALVYITELRWESFTPNVIRQVPNSKYPFPKSARLNRLFYSELVQLLIHVGIFIMLQSLPPWDWVKGQGILYTIWIVWTAIQLVLRYKTSPPLFGPIYLADSLASFWTETWHNAFVSPCLTLAYTPTMFLLRQLGAPKPVCRAAAVFSGFLLMAIFHVYALQPMLTEEGEWRIGMFFILNGVFTVIEVAIWGKKRHWFRAVMAWAIELSLSSWAVAAVDVADGVLEADWKDLCTLR
ncbi:hypothetical protein EJ04DRAFT_508978 [Polyplosphaeria fusca]|uniref:Wax synthase domain-containing protein n=1 Tax=Polyplosphaeria fusca TaxID=682080 RepID=A0A9P4V5Y6_9PLEO|nr:hypothetical protein EJ04DRAFT_508978 [Polyplosphaeria fusca]